MIHKFKDYDKNEQREIVFEIIRQKYLHSPQMNNFGENCKWVSNVIKNYTADKITEDELKMHLETNFYNRINKKLAEEVLFYFYHIADSVHDKSVGVDWPKAYQFQRVCKVISEIIDIDDLNNKVEPPEDKISSIDNSGGFTMVSSGRYPAPSSYTPPPPPQPMHDFKNPYTNKDFKSICDYIRWKIFDALEGSSIENFEDLSDEIDPTSLIPDSDEFINFPQCEDEDGEKEDLDFENPGDFIINNENSITFGGGGDWQEPQTFSFKLEKNGKIKAFDIHDDYNSDNWSSDASMILEIICKLFGLNPNYNPESTDPKDMVRLYNDMVKNKDFKLDQPKKEKLETSDCVQAIVDYFKGQNVSANSPLLDQKLWKRTSKTGSKDSIKREFENKKTGEKATVLSTETEILSINGVPNGTSNKSDSSNKSKYVLEVLDFERSKEEWQQEMYQDEGVNIGILVWLADDIECMCDRDIPDCLPELEDLDLGEVQLDDNGFLALISDLSVYKIKKILINAGFKLK